MTDSSECTSVIWRREHRRKEQKESSSTSVYITAHSSLCWRVHKTPTLKKIFWDSGDVCLLKKSHGAINKSLGSHLLSRHDCLGELEERPRETQERWSGLSARVAFTSSTRSVLHVPICQHFIISKRNWSERLMKKRLPYHRWVTAYRHKPTSICHSQTHGWNTSTRFTRFDYSHWFCNIITLNETSGKEDWKKEEDYFLSCNPHEENHEL